MVQAVFGTFHLRGIAVVHEILFWIHCALVLGAVLSGLFIPLAFVCALALIHRAHMVVFRGCALSRLQKALGGLPDQMDFLEFASRRLLRKKLTQRESMILDYSFLTVSLGIAAARSLWLTVL